MNEYIENSNKVWDILKETHMASYIPYKIILDCSKSETILWTRLNHLYRFKEMDEKGYVNIFTSKIISLIPSDLSYLYDAMVLTASMDGLKNKGFLDYSVIGEGKTQVVRFKVNYDILL